MKTIDSSSEDRGVDYYYRQKENHFCHRYLWLAQYG